MDKFLHSRDDDCGDRCKSILLFGCAAGHSSVPATDLAAAAERGGSRLAAFAATARLGLDRPEHGGTKCGPRRICTPIRHMTGGASDTTTTDTRSRRNRGGQLLPRALSAHRVHRPARTSCSRCLCPDGRTIRRDVEHRSGTLAPRNLIPVTNPIERLNGRSSGGPRWSASSPTKRPLSASSARACSSKR